MAVFMNMQTSLGVRIRGWRCRLGSTAGDVKIRPDAEPPAGNPWGHESIEKHECISMNVLQACLMHGKAWARRMMRSS